MGSMCWSGEKTKSKTAERLVLNDSTFSAVEKLSEGNFGALNVCTQLLRYGPAIDPQGLHGFGAFLNLDSLHIYGSRIWLLYKDICGENIVMMAACLRGWQLGIVNQKDLLKAIDNAESGNRANNLNLPAILAAVKEKLTDFGNMPEPESVPLPSMAVPHPASSFVPWMQPEPEPAPKPQPSPAQDAPRVINLD